MNRDKLECNLLRNRRSKTRIIQIRIQNKYKVCAFLNLSPLKEIGKIGADLNDKYSGAA